MDSQQISNDLNHIGIVLLEENDFDGSIISQQLIFGVYAIDRKACESKLEEFCVDYLEDHEVPQNFSLSQMHTNRIATC